MPTLAATPGHVRAAVALAAGLAALGLVAALPGLAPLLAWPFLFLLPGLLLVRRSVPGLGGPGQVGAGVVASILLSAHLGHLVALPLGLGRGSGLVTVALLMAASWGLGTRPLPGLGAPRPLPRLDAVRRSLAAAPSAWLSCGAAITLVLAVLLESAWRLTPQGYTAGGWNWSDLLVHVSIASSLQHGNLPPQIPYFAGEPLTYHWFGDFHAALVATVMGVHGAGLVPVMAVSNAVLGGALALLGHELALAVTGSRRTAALTPPLLLLGGGLGWIRLPIDVLSGHGSVSSLLSTTSYDNNIVAPWPYFRIASVLGTGLLDQRATAYGLPAVVAVIVILHRSWGQSRPGVLLAGSLGALLCPFHFFAFPALWLVVAIELGALRAWRTPDRRAQVALLLAPLPLGIGILVGPVLRQRSHGAVHAVLGWPDAPWHDGILAAAFFFVTNLGVPFVLALAAVIRPGMPGRGLLGGWMLTLFLVPNLVVVSAVSFDANKFFQIMWIAVAIAAAWSMRAWPRSLAAAAVAVSAVSPALVTVWHLRDDRVVLTVAQVRAADWIEANVPDRAVFVTDPAINSPVDLAGRLRITTYSLYVSNLGDDPSVRQRDVARVYCDGDATAASVMRRYAAAYVLSSGGRLDCGADGPTDFTRSPLFDTVYSGGGVTVWRLR